MESGLYFEPAKSLWHLRFSTHRQKIKKYTVLILEDVPAPQCFLQFGMLDGDASSAIAMGHRHRQHWEMKPNMTEQRAAYSIREFCGRYGIGRSATYEEIRSGRLAAVKVGGRTLIMKEAAEAWARSLHPA